MNKLKIGINGFGRIGRAITRINLNYCAYDIVAINEIDPDINNMAYLLKYDSTYGKIMEKSIEVYEKRLIIDGQEIEFFSEQNIQDVPWNDYQVDIVIDASGILDNVLNSRFLIKNGVKKVIITHSPKDGVDFTYIYGVNEHLYDKQRHHIVSGSICDANAVAPFFRLIHDAFGVEVGEVTTLHPWLSYQNLLDGNLRSVSSPGHYWNDYALGRSSVNGLIPKNTTLVPALEKVLPGISNCLHASSFRIPTSIVAVVDGTFFLKEPTTHESILGVLENYCNEYPGVLKLENQSLVSIDYLANENAAVVNTRWLSLKKEKMLKFALWYDNEWGYSSRIYHLMRLICG